MASHRALEDLLKGAVIPGQLSQACAMLRSRLPCGANRSDPGLARAEGFGSEALEALVGWV